MQQCGMEFFLKTNSYYSKEFNGFLKQIIISAGDVVSDALKAKLEI